MTISTKAAIMMGIKSSSEWEDSGKGGTPNPHWHLNLESGRDKMEIGLTQTSERGYTTWAILTSDGKDKTIVEANLSADSLENAKQNAERQVASALGFMIRSLEGFSNQLDG